MEESSKKVNKALEKKYDILNKAEDVILKKIENYGKHTEDMDKDDCYALQLLVMTEGRILSIRDGVNKELPY